ncbi:hypothetical protein HZA99_03755 [Candidatus Woesearchaeota archaeon]|nr:hypothetical protein [Candidatus Woesearchaeota archaeon]
MTTDISQRVQTQVSILNRYFIDGQTLATPAGFSAALYRENLDKMVADLQREGFTDASIVAVAAASGCSPITHRDGAFLNYHLVILTGNRILDPLYAGREPLDVGSYAARAFPEEQGVKLWSKTGEGRYQTRLQ